MTGISKLYCGTVEASDPLRYKRLSSRLPSHLLQFSKDKKPVVVWNVTQRCNLECIHCYSHSNEESPREELSMEEGFALIDDLAAFGSPVLLLSGGEPLTHPHIFALIRHAGSRGMRTVLSTNGTLISRETAAVLKELNLSYVGISLDGLKNNHDRFRNREGAYERALEGLRNCRRAGIKVGLRMTINRENVEDIPGIFKLMEEEEIPRICFYHLVYAGRGKEIMKLDLNHRETRKALNLIMRETRRLHDGGQKVEVLTVDNHADGVYLYLKMKEEGRPEADEVYKLLEMNGGNSSGNGIGCVSWDGSVHADQFWRHYSFGNVKDRPFSEIWTDLSNPLMAKLKNKKDHVKGRCAGCAYLKLCAGNFRVRAEAVYDDLWMEDPACYLTDREIGLIPENSPEDERSDA